MKAIVRDKYGSPDVLQLKEIDIPCPAGDQVLVKVLAATINKADLYLLKSPLLVRIIGGGGILKPKRQTFGTDMAGKVEAIGTNVKQFKTGDEVFGTASGVYAEYALAREDRLVLKPPNVTFEEAATVPVAAITALQGLRKGQVRPRQKVLINGASGGVGTFAVQIAKSFGAEVTAVCSTDKTEMAHSIGADHVIDYTQEDFTKSGQTYDVIIAVNGYHWILDYRRVLSPNGRYVLVGSSRQMTQLFQVALLGRLISLVGSKKIDFMGIAKVNQPDLTTLKELLETGKIKPVLDRLYALSEVPEAFRYFEEGHTKGKVVITI